MFRFVLCLLVALPAFTLSAQEDAAADVMAETQVLKARRAIAHGALFLQDQSDQIVQGWVIQPGIIPEYEWVVVKYRAEKRTRKRPIYEYEYVEVMKVVGSGSARRMQKVKERRVAGVKEYVEEEYTKLIRDPNGDVERKHRRAKVDTKNLEKGVTLQPGFMGQNAKAMYLLLTLGYGADDPTVQRLDAVMQTYIMSFGLPDATYDVAWLTAAYSKFPVRNAELDNIRLALLRKLVGGQMNDARLPGLWGPICIDHEVVSVHMATQMKIFEEKSAIQQELAAAKKRQKERDVEKAEERLREIDEEFAEVTHDLKMATWRGQFLVTPDYRQLVVLQPPHEGGGRSPNFYDNLYPVRVPAERFDMLSEGLTDLECTSWALFALAEAEAAGFLLNRLSRPDVGSKSFKDLDTGRAIERAYKAIMACYDKDEAGWHMGLQHVRLKDEYYESFEHIKDPEILKLDNQVSAMGNAAAFDCFRSLDRIIGMDDMGGSARQAAQAVQVKLDGYLEATKYLSNLRAKNIMPFGGRFLYSMIASLSGFRWELSDGSLTRAGAGEELANLLLKQQQKNGAWGGDKTRVATETYSAWMLMHARYEKMLEEHKDGERKRKPGRPRKVYMINGPGYMTIDAMGFLVESVWPAVIVHWRADGLMDSPVVLSRGLRYLNRGGMRLSYVATNSWPPPELPDSPACVVLTGRAALSPEQSAALSPLFPYVQAGGVLVVEAPASQEGIAFCNSIFEGLGPALPEKTFGDMPADSILLDGMEKVPKMRAVIRGDGTVAAVFLMVGKEDNGYAMSSKTAARVLAQVMRNRLPPMLLETSYLTTDDYGSSFDFPDLSEEDVEDAAESDIIDE